MFPSIELLLICIPALPLAAAVVTAVLGPRWLRSHSHWPAVAAIAASFVCSAALVLQVRRAQNAVPAASGGYEKVVILWTWARVDTAYQQAGPGGAAGDGGLWRDFRIDIALRADALTAVMLAMVTFISWVVAVFSIGYMRGDRGYWRFFSYIALFVFSMTMLVSASNFALLYIFWEAVGVCSYLLIGFWYQKPQAAAAGKKAFLVNRVGDFGFALALFLIWTTYGTLNYHDEPLGVPSAAAAAASEAAADGATDPAPTVLGVLGPRRIESGQYVGGGVGMAICLLLLLGACGKSAQFPLHVWLPDAMEGPTPVSALIHAATMVTAGVYMIARCSPLFMASPDAQLAVAGVGAFTALLAALIALTQFDLKRILAYSTISQLGYMFLALGTGTLAGVTAGMFHLFTHAFFKALLFLGAGSVMHAMGGVIDIRRFGGLRRRLPITHWTFLIGCLALAGAAPLSGFFSKDAIVAAVHEKAHELEEELARRGAPADGELAERSASAGGSAASSGGVELSLRQLERNARIYRQLYLLAMLTAVLTAFYAFRAFFVTFYGPEKIPAEAGGHAHESPPVMWVPLVVLAAGAAVVGFCLDRTPLGGSHGFAEFLAPTPSLAGGAIAHTASAGVFHWRVAGWSTTMAAAGILAAVYFYLGGREEAARLRSVLNLDGFARLSGLDWTSQLAAGRGAAALRRAAQAARLGWLATAILKALSLAAAVVSAPLLLAYYVSPYKLSLHKFYFDEIYDVLVVKPLRAVAWLSYGADRWVVDGLVNFCGWVPRAVGALLRTTQRGLTSFYALAMALGVAVLIVAGAFWAAG